MGDPFRSTDLDEAAEETRSGGGRVERLLVLLANAIWVVVGLFLWIPQLARVVLTSVARLVHTALTRQPVDAVREPIRRASRFYVDGFLARGGPSSWSGGVYAAPRKLRPLRFLAEALWIALFWLLVVRLLSRSAFDRLWSAMNAGASWLWEAVAGLARSAAAFLPEGFRALLELGTGARMVLALLLALVFLGAFLLGRRRR